MYGPGQDGEIPRQIVESLDARLRGLVDDLAGELSITTVPAEDPRAGWLAEVEVTLSTGPAGRRTVTAISAEGDGETRDGARATALHQMISHIEQLAAPWT
jgi:hypothetical protein